MRTMDGIKELKALQTPGKRYKQIGKLLFLAFALVFLAIALSGCDSHGGKEEQKTYEQKLLQVLKHRYNEDFEITKMTYNLNLKQYDYEVKSKVPPYVNTYGSVSVLEPIDKVIFKDSYGSDYLTVQMQRYFYPKIKALFPKDAYYYIAGSIHGAYGDYASKIYGDFKNHKPKLEEILKEKPDALYQSEMIHVYLDLDKVNREDLLKKAYSYFRAHKDLGMQGLEIEILFIDNSARELWKSEERYAHLHKGYQDFFDARRDAYLKHVYFLSLAIPHKPYDRINSYEAFVKEYQDILTTKREERK